MGFLRRVVFSLTGRIVLVTFAVSLIAVLVTAVVSLQVVQSVAENQARQQLRAQANILVSESRTSTTQVERLTQRIVELGDRFAVIRPDGTVVGAARASVGPDVVRRVLAGQSVSATTTVGGKDAVLAALPRPGGGGIVGVRKVADIKAGNAELVRWIVLALAAGLVTAMVAGTLLSRRIGRPLTQLASSARELAHGDRGVDIRTQPVAEIEDIALALRTLDVALSTSEERQRDFLLSVSHEIRTPLTAIRGYAEALADGVIPAEEVTGIGATLTAESERLRRFVDDLLELARLEADDFPIDPLEFDVRDTLLRASRAWAGASERLGAQLRTDLPPQAVLIVSDEMRVRQIVDGLLENALRVTPPGGPLVLAATGTTDGVDIEVRDSGPGLTAEDSKIAFDRGALHARYRGDRPVGTGLGLSISQRLAGRLGGSIEVEPAPEGGALFRVHLPR